MNAVKTGTCFECGEQLEETGRNTLYCPSCNVCPECNCPDADGFRHYAGCKISAQACEYCGCERETTYMVADWALSGEYCSVECASRAIAQHYFTEQPVEIECMA